MSKIHSIEPYFEFVAHYYLGRDAGHDIRHIARIFERLDELSEGCAPRPRLHRLHFLAAFHGLGNKLNSDSEFRILVEDFLKSLGWENNEIPEAFLSLERHLTTPRCIEEMIVYDANFFEVTGCFGIAKAFTVGGHHGQTYERTLEIFEANLDKVVFQTPVGRAKYESRKEFARAFIAELRVDLDSRSLDQYAGGS